MKKIPTLACRAVAFAVPALTLLGHAQCSTAESFLTTTPPTPSIPRPAVIDPINHYSYGANIGWVDWRGDTNSGLAVSDYICSGYIYSANLGWINLGNGNPVNRIAYQNNSATDFGVNVDTAGNLRGYAYSANVGWINFETNGAAAVNLLTGNFSGNAWSANCGWMSLSNMVAHVQTDTISPGPLDTNGLPIPWELTYFGQTGVDPNADPDHDGISNGQEYLAGTSPINGNDFLAFTAENFSADGTHAALTWNSVPSRYYFLQKTLSLAATNWLDSGLGMIAPDGAATERNLTDTAAPMRFFRVQAVRPLSP